MNLDVQGQGPCVFQPRVRRTLGFVRPETTVQERTRNGFRPSPVNECARSWRGVGSCGRWTQHRWCCPDGEAWCLCRVTQGSANPGLQYGSPLGFGGRRGRGEATGTSHGVWRCLREGCPPRMTRAFSAQPFGAISEPGVETPRLCWALRQFEEESETPLEGALARRSGAPGFVRPPPGGDASE